jgi:hypothetical protein
LTNLRGMMHCSGRELRRLTARSHLPLTDAWRTSA